MCVCVQTIQPYKTTYTQTEVEDNRSIILQPYRYAEGLIAGNWGWGVRQALGAMLEATHPHHIKVRLLLPGTVQLELTLSKCKINTKPERFLLRAAEQHGIVEQGHLLCTGWVISGGTMGQKGGKHGATAALLDPGGVSHPQAEQVPTGKHRPLLSCYPETTFISW